MCLLMVIWPVLDSLLDLVSGDGGGWGGEKGQRVQNYDFNLKSYFYVQLDLVSGGGGHLHPLDYSESRGIWWTFEENLVLNLTNTWY